MTTFQQWVDAFRPGNMAITGVKRHYNEPPSSISTADLPAAWPSIFGGGYNGQRWSCNEMNQEFSMSFVVACEAVNQNRIPENYQQMVTIADNLLTALNGVTVTTFVRPLSIASANVTIGGNSYYGLVCTIEGSNGGL